MPDYYSIEVPMTPYPYPQKNHNRQWAAVALAAAGVFGMALVWVGVSGLAAERATHITYLTADIDVDVDAAASQEPPVEVETVVEVVEEEKEDLMSDHISEDHHANKDALLADLMSEAPKEDLLSDLMAEDSSKDKESAEEEFLSDHIEDEAAKEEVLAEVMADDSSKEELLSEHIEEAPAEESEHVAEPAAEEEEHEHAARDEALEVVMAEEDPHEDELLSDHMQEDAPSPLDEVEDVEQLEAEIVADDKLLSDDLVVEAPKEEPKVEVVEKVVEKKPEPAAPAATGLAAFRERLANTALVSRLSNVRNANLDLGASRGATGIGAGIAVDKEGERTLSGSVSGSSMIANWKAGLQKAGDGPLTSTLDLSQEQHGSTFGLRFKKAADAALQWSGGIAHKKTWDSTADSKDATGAGGDPVVLTADVGTTKGDLKVSAGVRSTDGDLNLRAGVAGQSEANSWSLGIDTGSLDKPGNWKMKVGLGN